LISDGNNKAFAEMFGASIVNTGKWQISKRQKSNKPQKSNFKQESGLWLLEGKSSEAHHLKNCSNTQARDIPSPIGEGLGVRSKKPAVKQNM
jgi:hypothetical protein